MDAILLAGGKATRLYPVTMFMPKQLMMVNGRPVIEYIIEHLKNNGVNRIILCISDNKFQSHFTNALGDGSRFGVEIVFSTTPETYGTAGRVAAATKYVNNNFVVYYGDIITDFSLRQMLDEHETNSDKKGLCTLAITNNNRLEFGVALCDKSDGRILKFKEKPLLYEVTEHYANCGIAACTKDIVRFCTEEGDFFGDAMPLAMVSGMEVFGYDVGKSMFFDVGTFSSLESILKTMSMTKS